VQIGPKLAAATTLLPLPEHMTVLQAPAGASAEAHVSPVSVELNIIIAAFGGSPTTPGVIGAAMAITFVLSAEQETDCQA
jgi:hypothetical protein